MLIFTHLIWGLCLLKICINLNKFNARILPCFIISFICLDFIRNYQILKSIHGMLEITENRNQYMETCWRKHELGPHCFSLMTSSNGNIFRVTMLLARCAGYSPVTGEFPSPKGQWRGALMFSSMCAWINGWVTNRDTCDLRHHSAYYDVTVMGDGLSMVSYC